MNNKLITIVTVGVILFLGTVGFLMNVHYDNREIELRNAAEAKQEANTARFDEMWKSIKQVANVTDKYADDFKEIYVGLMDGRYEADSKSNPMFKFISEHNPQLDAAVYRDLSNTIVAKREAFTRDQQKLIDIKREHDNLRLKFPAKLFVSASALDITVVTSGKTKEIFAAGEENDVELF
jgi:hypothetical protein